MDVLGCVSSFVPHYKGGVRERKGYGKGEEGDGE